MHVEEVNVVVVVGEEGMLQIYTIFGLNKRPMHVNKKPLLCNTTLSQLTDIHTYSKV